MACRNISRLKCSCIFIFGEFNIILYKLPDLRAPTNLLFIFEKPHDYTTTDWLKLIYGGQGSTGKSSHGLLAAARCLILLRWQGAHWKDTRFPNQFPFIWNITRFRECNRLDAINFCWAQSVKIHTVICGNPVAVFLRGKFPLNRSLFLKRSPYLMAATGWRHLLLPLN